MLFYEKAMHYPLICRALRGNRLLDYGASTKRSLCGGFGLKRNEAVPVEKELHFCFEKVTVR